MATTTNYGWTTPNDTDLVKDGAAAIRTLGSSVDTTTKALNPSTTLGDIEYRSSTANTNTRLGIGTTGQVLSVVGGVPAWATSDDANAIQNAIVDAKGDIVAASAADTPARLAVGTDNQRLIAASGEATGLKYVSDTQNTVIDAAGDLLYGTAADTVGKLAIGSTGNILTVAGGVPTWAAPAGGGGMTLLSTTTLSGASTTISSISQDYVDLKIYVVNYDPSNADQGCAIQMNADATANRHLSIAMSETTSTAYNAVKWEVASRASATVNEGLTVITIFKYADTTIRKTGEVWQSNIPAHTSSNNVFQSRLNVFYNQTTAISSVKFIAEANTMAGGTVLIYGVK